MSGKKNINASDDDDDDIVVKLNTAKPLMKPIQKEKIPAEP